MFFFTADTRETGFVHAMTSAAIVHKIATGCAQGTIMDCYCDVKAKPYRTLHPNCKFTLIHYHVY